MNKLNFSTKLFFLFVCILFFIVEANGLSNTMKRYNLKQACIEYTVSGAMQNGTEVLYFDNWGAREAKYTKTTLKMAGMSQETNTVTFLEGAWTYTVDLDRQTGTKTENPFLKDIEGDDPQEMGKEMMVKMGGKIIGTEKILGKRCDIWEIKNMGVKTWVWNWVTLKTETNMMGMEMTNVATKINDSFDKKMLQRPTNIKYNDMGNVMNKFKNLQKGLK
jgi:hypothetical protein